MRFTVQKPHFTMYETNYVDTLTLFALNAIRECERAYNVPYIDIVVTYGTYAHHLVMKHGDNEYVADIDVDTQICDVRNDIYQYFYQHFDERFKK